MSLLITVAVGLCASLLVKDRELHQGLELENAICDKLRRDVAQKRKRIKKNVFTDSLRPKAFYRIYALVIMIGLMIFAYEGVNFSLTNLDYQFLRASIVCLFFVIVCPFLIENTFSKRYTFIYLSLLGFSLPFFGAVMMFSHFNNVFFGYFYLGSIFVLGTMIGWTMLSTITMLATAFAGQISAFLCPEMGVPGNWAILSIGVLSIFTYYAMLAARESIAIEKCLTVVHTIAKKMLSKTLNTASRLILSGRSLTLQDMHILVKGVGEVESTLSCLVGATNLEPEQALIPLSVKTSLHHALKRFSIQSKNSVRIEGEDDFYVLGSRDIFENILFHLLDNAIYYLERNEATLIICTLDAQKKTLSIANNGPTIHLKDRLYIFDLGYSRGKDGVGLGLTYCKKMLEGMRSTIKLVSNPYAPWVIFMLSFPAYAIDLEEELKKKQSLDKASVVRLEIEKVVRGEENTLNPGLSLLENRMRIQFSGNGFFDIGSILDFEDDGDGKN